MEMNVFISVYNATIFLGFVKQFLKLNVLYQTRTGWSTCVTVHEFGQPIALTIFSWFTLRNHQHRFGL